MFCGREEELQLLERRYHSSRRELVVLYGRRRIGKSRLIEQFLKGKKFFHFEALEGERTPQQLKHFREALRQQREDPLLGSLVFESWETIFEYLTEKVLVGEDKVVLFFDEFQWMAAGQSRLVSLVKYFWDVRWKDKNVMLILCGSISSFMVEKVIHSKALYGRITLEILLKGLGPAESLALFRGKRSLHEVLKYLMVFGGVPRYLEEVDLQRSFSKNMNELCFSPDGFMVNDFSKIFYSQFKETQIYLKIVRLLQDRICALNEISSELEIPSGGGLKHYLTNLENAEMIRSYISFDRPLSTKNRKYKLADEYLVFYFKYIEPHLRSIRDHVSSRLFETLCEKKWQPWLGIAFERFCLKNASLLARLMNFSDETLLAAPYFEREDGHFQVDLIYQRTDQVIVVCEIKYWDQPVGTRVIPEVEKKCRSLRLPRNYTLEKALISIHGPDKPLQEARYFDHYVVLEDFFK